MEIGRIDTLPGSPLRVRHLGIGIILILIALTVFRIRLLGLRLLRSCEILITLRSILRLILRRCLAIRRLRRWILCILSPTFLFFRFSHAVRQDEFCRLFKVFRKDIFSSRQCRFSSGGFDEINIRTMSRHMCLQCIDGGQLDHGR